MALYLGGRGGGSISGVKSLLANRRAYILGGRGGGVGRITEGLTAKGVNSKIDFYEPCQDLGVSLVKLT